MIKISIITINFNNAAGLKKTLESIKNLKCPDGVELESIVVDGASRDSSLEIIKSYTDTITQYVSEPDNGIYDAMNKGIRMASGQWLNFMNSGDVFASVDVIYKLMQKNLFLDKSISLILGENLKLGVLQPKYDISIVKKGIIPGCHQSMFFRNLHRFYNLSYNIYSDFDYFLSYYLDAPESIRFIDLVVSESEPDGVGAKVSSIKRKDKLIIMIKRFGPLCTLKFYLKKLSFFVD